MGKEIEVQHQVIWEGRYSQCSYNNLASVLDCFYGTPTEYPSENIFFEALPAEMRGYYGWAPYIGFMVTNKQLEWNSKPVVDLNCDWFELKTRNSAEREGTNVIIQFEEGELEKLEEKLIIHLKKGPLVLWVPYAAGRFRFSPLAAWKNVKQIAANKYQAVVPWYTHCVVIGGYKNGLFRIFDCSDKDGVFLVPTPQLVVNVAAMVVNPAVEKLAFLDGLKFHCCMFQNES